MRNLFDKVVGAVSNRPRGIALQIQKGIGEIRIRLSIISLLLTKRYTFLQRLISGSTVFTCTGFADTVETFGKQYCRAVNNRPYVLIEVVPMYL